MTAINAETISVNAYAPTRYGATISAAINAAVQAHTALLSLSAMIWPTLSL